MSFTTKCFAGLSALVHIVFFLMESLFWSNPAVHGLFKVTQQTDAEIIDVFIKNQGFYNLFLALGIFAGLALARRHQIASKILITYICLFMFGAALVLLFTKPEMLSGVFIQGIPPLIALFTLHYNRSSSKHE